MVDLDIYVERGSNFNTNYCYILRNILPSLEKNGLTYRVRNRFNPDDSGGSAFIHVDLTELPKEFRDIYRSYPRCINGRATTISRRLYSRVMLNQNDDFDGPVIVKASLNHRGCPELWYKINRNFATKISHRLRARLIKNYTEKVCPPYCVYKSIRDVPPETWRDATRIVEKFLPGSFNLPIVKHRCEFFLDVELNTRAVFNSLLCDPANMTSFEVKGKAPQIVTDVRRSLNLDFGSIDYFMVGDEAYVIDANKTTSITEDWVNKYPAIAKYLEQTGERLLEFVKAS